jgi:hypothetical protein
MPGLIWGRENYAHVHTTCATLIHYEHILFLDPLYIAKQDSHKKCMQLNLLKIAGSEFVLGVGRYNILAG